MKDKELCIGVIGGILIPVLFFLWIQKGNEIISAISTNRPAWENSVVYLSQDADGNITIKEVEDETIRDIQEATGKESEFYLASDGAEQNLYHRVDDKEEDKLVANSIMDFEISQDRKKAYCIAKYYEPNALGFEIHYGLIEVDLKTKENMELTDRNLDDINFSLWNLNDEFLFYIETFADSRKSNIYQFDLQNGKQTCIYKSKKKITKIVLE